MNSADTLKALRLAAGLTQQQLADLAGIDRSWLNQMERGRKPITRSPREKLAAALGVDQLELGGGEQESPKRFRSLAHRLEELEAAFDVERRRRERALRAVTRRLAEFEGRLALLEQRGDHPQTGRGQT